MIQITSSEQQNNGTQPKQRSTLKEWIIATILVIFAIVVMMIAIKVGTKSEITPKTESSSFPSSLSVGTEGYTKSNGGSGVVFCVVSKSDWDTVIGMETAQDKIGLYQFVVQGRLLLLDDKVAVRVINTGIFGDQVRIESGKYFGESCWIDKSEVVPKASNN